MVIWSGKGFWVAILIFISSLGVNLVTNAVTGGDLYWQSHRWPFGVSLLISGALSSALSWHVRPRHDRTLIDPSTGEAVLVKGEQHSLFFVPVNYWGPILFVLGLIVVAYDLAM